MKINFLTAALALMLGAWAMPTHSYGCDVCGCGAGAYYGGALPQFHKNLLGLRARFLSYQNLHEAARRTERFGSMELWGRFYPHRKLQVLGFLPMGWHNTDEQHYIGLRDASILAMYNLVNTTAHLDKSFKNNLLLGGGLKLPTGAYRQTDANGDRLPAGMQLGTGSLDFVLMGSYTLRYRKHWGLQTDASYKLNLSNLLHYRFGNRLTTSANLFYIGQAAPKLGWMVQAGVSHEVSGSDMKLGYEVAQTGGTLLLANAGFDFFIQKSWNLGVSVQVPLQQNLSDGLIKAQPRLLVQMNHLF